VKTINLHCADNNFFLKYQAQEGVLTPTPPLRTPLVSEPLLYSNRLSGLRMRRVT